MASIRNISFFKALNENEKKLINNFDFMKNLTSQSRYISNTGHDRCFVI